MKGEKNEKKNMTENEWSANNNDLWRDQPSSVGANRK